MSERPREWDATCYHEVASPQTAWALEVLEQLPLRGDETVLDAGCGSGRVTEKLLERLPRGSVVAVDASRNMIEAARVNLTRFGDRVRFLLADLTELRLDPPVDVVFSTAVFHWIRDHDRLFSALFRNLVPGGRLYAQCGGGPNVKRIRDRASAVLSRPPFAPRFEGWKEPWFFPEPEGSAERLRRAGFMEVKTGLEPRDAVLPDGPTYRDFLRTVVCWAYLDELEEEVLKERFLDEMVERGARDAPPWSLDYVRLNLRGRRPG